MAQLRSSSDWSYVGEGGKHALFAYVAQGEDSADYFHGGLLRIQKRLLAAALQWSPEINEDSATLGADEDPSLYIQNFVAPSLFPYVDVPQKMTLEWDFLKDLHNQTLSERRIPASRTKDWIAPGGHKDFFLNIPTCMLIKDLRQIRIPRLMTTKTEIVYISVEIKPKAGYLPISPLIDPLSRCKYKKSRFVLLQKLHQQGLCQKGWVKDSESVEKSDYDPLDLFSSDRLRIKKAIDALFSCPQNNLRVWCDHHLLFGHTVEEECSERMCCEIMERVFGKSSTRNTRMHVKSLLTSSLLAILSQQEVLLRLLEAQKLDILDADGAIRVFQRLVALNGGSMEAAEASLDEENRPVATKSAAEIEMLRHSPFTPPHLSPNFERFCEEISRFQRELASASPGLPSTRSMDASEQRAIRTVKNLSAQDCHFLLLNWLYSLALCDASIFITFEASDPPEKIVSQPTTYQSTCDGRTSAALNRKSGTDPGEVTWWCDESTVQLLFLVRVIDCDRKPARKLRDRQARERLFRKLD